MRLSHGVRLLCPPVRVVRGNIHQRGKGERCGVDINWGSIEYSRDTINNIKYRKKFQIHKSVSLMQPSHHSLGRCHSTTLAEAAASAKFCGT